MSRFSENKFLIGFAAVTLAGTGVLAYLTKGASDNYEASLGTLTAARDELKKVENLKPFPSEAALKQLLTETQEIRQKLDALQQDFKSRVLPVLPIGKEAFQVQLRDSVARVTAAFTERQVKLGDKISKDFYLDYKEYQDKPPEDAAAPLLARQLKAMAVVMDLLIQEGHLELVSLTREPFTEERKKTGTPEPKAGSTNPGAGSRKLVEKTGFSVKFLASDEAFRRIVNGIAGNKSQLFIIRRIAVQNEHLNSPPRSVALNPPDPVPATPPATPGSPVVPESKAREYVFGKERVEATIDIEVLDFAEPEKRPTPAGKGPR